MFLGKVPVNTYGDHKSRTLKHCLLLPQAATVALSALIHALHETNMCAIARRVYDARSSPRVGCLIAHIKPDYEVSKGPKFHSSHLPNKWKF